MDSGWAISVLRTFLSPFMGRTIRMVIFISSLIRTGIPLQSGNQVRP